jgi:hypothetical protein
MMKLGQTPGRVLIASLAVATLAAAASALARDAGVEAPAAVPPSLYGVYDDVASGKRLTMTILRPGHPFCTQRVKTKGPCSRTPLAGGLIGARVVVLNDRLSFPEAYRTPNLGTLCSDFIPVYRIPSADARLILSLVGYRNRAGKPVSARAVRAADCVPPGRWQHRLEERKPYGTYKVTLDPADPDVPAGVWTLTLRPGRYSLLNEQPISNSGSLRIAGGILTFSRETLCPSAVGRYRWRLAGRMLRLTLVGKDPCSGNDRTVVLTSKLWSKQG